MAKKRRIRGDRAFKKLLVRMPEAIRQEVVELLEETGTEIAAMQRADATSSRARAAISARVLRGALQLKVGLVGRPLNRRLWWTRIIEKGRKGSTEAAVRRTRSGRISRYNIRVPVMAARPFIWSARVINARTTMSGKLERFWARALTKASQGVTDD